MPLLLPNQAWVLGTYAAFLNETPGNKALTDHVAFIEAKGLDAYKAAVNVYFQGMSNTDLAASVLSNLGIPSNVVSTAQAAAVLEANASNRAGVILDFAYNLYTGSDSSYAAQKAAFVNAVNASYNYSIDAAHIQGTSIDVLDKGFTLTTGQDRLAGTSLDDIFTAYIVDNTNTLNSNDILVGGAGVDTLQADIGNSQAFAITPRTKGIEVVQIRAEAADLDGTNGNNTSSGAFVYGSEIDAQRMSDVTWWESNGSRSDVIIEDVRIANDQKTSDVTIAFVESDPGNVDLGLYFDQLSLRNASTGSSTLKINIMDTGAAAAEATAATPLLNNPYDVFKLGINGVLTTIALDKTAVAAADTYEALLTVFQAALAGTGVTASLTGTFTITDPISSKAVTGKSIVLTSSGNVAISTPAGSGWFNTTGASVPATSNIYTTYSNAATSVSELVTSKIVLDDVGRGSTGGDLVVGGMSTGDTSTSRGVERFEIEVRDNSKLQTINSTNNALREVVIKNGVTSNTIVDAYTKTVKDEGNLTVNGDAAQPATGGVQSAGDNQLPGVENNSPEGIHHGVGTSGFVDVRLIDASEFKGKLAFTAAITSDSIAKYINLSDTQADPAGDVAGSGNVNFDVKGANFIYTGGNDDDTMAVTIDGAVAGSRSTVVSGQSDFTFAFNGGDGKDAITLTVMNNALDGGAQHWYTNQKLNANITIDSGAGDDTIKTPGAGDVIINAGTGADVVYTDNTGALTSAVAPGAGDPAAVAYATNQAVELAAAQAASVASNTTGFSYVDGTATGAVVTPTAVVNALITLDRALAVNFPDAAVTHATVAAAINAATAAGALTLDQELALNAAYNVTTGGVVTPPTTLVASAISGEVAVAGNLTAAEFAAGNALLTTYLTTAKAAEAAAIAADADKAAFIATLTGTAAAVVAATEAVYKVDDDGAAGGNVAGTQTKVNGLATLQGALVTGATDATVVAALKAAINGGAITVAQAGALFTAATANGAGAIDNVAGGELAGITAILSPLKTAADLANTTALAALATATAANTAAVDAYAADVSVNTPDAVNPAAEAALAAAADAAAAAASKVAADKLAGAEAINAALAALKAAVPAGASDVQIDNALLIAADATAKGAVAAGIPDPLAGGAVAALRALATTAPGLTATVDADEKGNFDTGYDATPGSTNTYTAGNVDELITTVTRSVDALRVEAADAAKIAADAHVAAVNAAAAAASGSNSLVVAAPTAVFVFNTSDQTSTYDRATQDDRNLADLKSDANDSYNFFNTTLSVTYKGIEAKVVVPGSGYHTSDLQLNQAIKAAVTNDAVLSKLIAVTDGPANSLVVKSLIDGVHVENNLAITVTLPASVTSSDLSGAIAAGLVGTGATEANLLTAMGAALTTFNTNGDYVTQFAESGATGGNAALVGANSTTTSDNTINLGDGNDVLVLGTTVGTNTLTTLTSSNEKVVFTGAAFGSDTIVHFDATGLGIDVLDFTALGGSGAVAFNDLATNKSIVVAAPDTTPLTATEIAALFTDSATAISHVYVAVDGHNIGSVWQVADAAGTAAGNVTATLVGTIDLADTAWGTLTAANFV